MSKTRRAPARLGDAIAQFDPELRRGGELLVPCRARAFAGVDLVEIARAASRERLALLERRGAGARRGRGSADVRRSCACDGDEATTGRSQPVVWSSALVR